MRGNREGVLSDCRDIVYRNHRLCAPELEGQILHSILNLAQFQNLSGDLQVTNSLSDC